MFFLRFYFEFSLTRFSCFIFHFTHFSVCCSIFPDFVSIFAAIYWWHDITQMSCCKIVVYSLWISLLFRWKTGIGNKSWFIIVCGELYCIDWMYNVIFVYFIFDIGIILCNQLEAFTQWDCSIHGLISDITQSIILWK